MPLDYALRRPARSEAHEWAESLLEQVGLATRMDHESSQMSGGQQQRVAIARALVNRPTLLLADEPTGNLDSRTGDEILRMFQRLNAQGITVILVTHDAKVAAYANRTIRIVDGLIADDSNEPSEAVSLVTAAVTATLLGPASLAAESQKHVVPRRHYGDGAAMTAANEAQRDARGAGSRDFSADRAERRGRKQARGGRRFPACSAVVLGRFPAPAHAAHGPGQSEAEQDAIGAHGPGRDHRRGGRHRHDGNRTRIQSSDRKNDRRHGRQ